MVEACATNVHKHAAECDFLEPDDATLDRMAECGVVRYDFPAMFAKADEMPAFDEQWLDLVGASEDERELMVQLGDGFRDELFTKLEALANEAGLPAWPTDVTLLTAVVDLNKHYGDDAMRRASGVLARERAGLAEPPARGADQPAVARFLRLFTRVGDDFETAIAERLGEARARELHAAGDGWPGLKFQTGVNESCR